jgi:SHS2 domain-containing protein
VALDAGSSYRFFGWRGHDVAIEVDGPTLAACVARAVEAFSSELADVHPSIVLTPMTVAVEASSPSLLLERLLDRVVQLVAEGTLPITADRVERNGATDRYLVRLQTVDASVARRLRLRPTSRDWRDVHLDQSPEGWHGVVVA